MMNTNHVKQFLVQNIMCMDQSDTLFLQQMFTLLKRYLERRGH